MTTRGDHAGGVGRRRFLRLLGAGSAGLIAASPLRSGVASPARAVRVGDDYGPLGPPDEWGVRVPAGFRSRLVARTGDAVVPTGYVWHGAPDGGACFPGPDSVGHVYVSNSEVAGGRGGASAIVFDGVGGLRWARSILSGTSLNCAGGATPWGTWLSCEENGAIGQVWECSPHGAPATVRPALGSFNHEAAAVDAARRCVVLTEDAPDGRLYRFVPDRWPDLSTGRLAAASVSAGIVEWVPVAPTAPERSARTTAFDGGEGILIDGDGLLFATKGDRRIWELDLVRSRLSVFHDWVASPGTPLSHVDNLAGHPISGHIFVAEDGGDMDLCMLARTSTRPIVTRVVRFEGHDGSEVAGPAFSPDGRFLYVSSQRGTDGRGMTFQIAGPFLELARSIDGAAEVGRRAVRLPPVGG